MGRPLRWPQAGCIGTLGTRHHLRHRGDQIVANVAADTAIREIDDVPLAFDADNELGINVDRTEVVHQYSDAQAVVAVENAVEQRRLARAEKACEHRQGDRRRFVVEGMVNELHWKSSSPRRLAALQ